MGFLIFIFCLSANAQDPLRFVFGSTEKKRGVVRVQAADVYTRERGFGFEPGAKVQCLEEKTKVPGICTSDKPFYFSIAVPEGNYRVTVTLGGGAEATNETVKAELRRLMLQNLVTGKGETVTRSFIVNIRRPQITSAGEVKLKDREKTSEQWAWDEKLTLEFNGTHPSVRSIEIESVNVPTIFLLGDSTVCDQPSEPYASWGQMLTSFLTQRSRSPIMPNRANRCEVRWEQSALTKF